MIRRLTVLAVALAFTGVGCGGGSKDAANAIKGMAASGQYAAMKQAKRYVREELKIAEGQAWLAKFQAEAGQPMSKAAETNLGCGSVSGSGTSSSPYSITCTSTAAETFSCTKTGGDTITYTVASGATMTLTFFTDTGSLTSATSMTFSADFTATITGGEFSSVSVDCLFGFTISLSDAAADPTIDCSNANFKCTVGSETFDCDSLKSGMNEDFSCT